MIHPVVVKNNIFYQDNKYNKVVKLEDYNTCFVKYLEKNILSVQNQSFKNFEHIIVDGNKFKPFGKIPHQCIIKGDSKFLSIAAASVLAKNYRDELMLKLHADFPQYAWDKNKGYPTKTHRKSILTFGPTQFHRMTFNLLGDSVQLDLFP